MYTGYMCLYRYIAMLISSAVPVFTNTFFYPNLRGLLDGMGQLQFPKKTTTWY